jgi:hypothetical protein
MELPPLGSDQRRGAATPIDPLELRLRHGAIPTAF